MGHHLRPITQPIAVSIRVTRVRPVRVLLQVAQSIPVRIPSGVVSQRVQPVTHLPPVRHPIIITVRIQRIRPMGQNLLTVIQPVVIAVTVNRYRTTAVFLQIHQPIAVVVAAGIRQSVNLVTAQSRAVHPHIVQLSLPVVGKGRILCPADHYLRQLSRLELSPLAGHLNPINVQPRIGPVVGQRQTYPTAADVHPRMRIGITAAGPHQPGHLISVVIVSQPESRPSSRAIGQFSDGCRIVIRCACIVADQRRHRKCASRNHRPALLYPHVVIGAVKRQRSTQQPLRPVPSGHVHQHPVIPSTHGITRAQPASIIKRPPPLQACRLAGKRIQPVTHLPPVRHPIVIAVRIQRIRPMGQHLRPIAQLIIITVRIQRIRPVGHHLRPITQPIAVSIRVTRVRPVRVLLQVAQSIPVRIPSGVVSQRVQPVTHLPPVRHPIIITVRIQRIRLVRILLNVAQSIPVRIPSGVVSQRVQPVTHLPPIRHPVIICIAIRWICTPGNQLCPIGQPIAV